jgi:hypothetical protein
MREVALAVSVYTLRYFANGNNFEDLKFWGVTSQSAGITVPETWLMVGGQTVTEYCAVLSTVFRAVQCFVSDFILLTLKYCDILKYYPSTVINTVQ